MGKIRLVEKGMSLTGKLELPAFYMNDFSVLGIVVSGVGKAGDILRGCGFTLHEEGGMTWVRFERSGEMHQMIDKLREQGIACTLSDLMSCAYQG